MTESLLDKAVENLNVSQMIMNGMQDDEIYLNYVGYHLQQAVELAIKYMLETNGVQYPKTHDIEQLVRICHKEDIKLPDSDYIEEHAEMFSVWESKTRYVLGYQLEIGKIQKALPAVCKFLKAIQKEFEAIDTSKNYEETEKINLF